MHTMAKAASNSPYVIRDLSPQFSSIVIVGSLPWAFIGKSATMWSSLDSIFIILFFTSANLPLHLIADHFSTVMKLNTGNKEMNNEFHPAFSTAEKSFTTLICSKEQDNCTYQGSSVSCSSPGGSVQRNHSSCGSTLYKSCATYLLVSPSWWAISHIWRKWGF